jgi:hypothetical protein
MTVYAKLLGLVLGLLFVAFSIAILHNQDSVIGR